MLDEATRQRIESMIQSDRVVLFMKGTPEQPQCGFSATTTGILDTLVSAYTTVNVLADGDIREGIKEYANWPTIPQLYIDNELVGGCDIVMEMFNKGELHQLLDLEPPDRTPPELVITDAAAEVLRDAVRSQPGSSVHFRIGADWKGSLTLAPASGHEIATESKGVQILLDLGTAQRARGCTLDIVDGLQGKSLRIDNPNAPAPVNQMTVQELKQKLDSAESVHLFDVRSPDEREIARIEGARPLDEEAVKFIEALPKDTLLVFHCHLGPRSESAAEYFRSRGFTNLHTIGGGIDAWSREIDPRVPRY